MYGVQSWDFSEFHPDCVEVDVVDIAGVKHVYCRSCKVLANLDAVSTKFLSYAESKKTGKGLAKLERQAKGVN